MGCGCKGRAGPKLVFDEIINSGSPTYTMPEWDSFLGDATEIAVMAVCTDIIVGSSPTITITTEFSPNGVNWVSGTGIYSGGAGGGNPVIPGNVFAASKFKGLRMRIGVYCSAGHVVRVRIYANPVEEREDTEDGFAFPDPSKGEGILLEDCVSGGRCGGCTACFNWLACVGRNAKVECDKIDQSTAEGKTKWQTCQTNAMANINPSLLKHCIGDGPKDCDDQASPCGKRDCVSDREQCFIEAKTFAAMEECMKKSNSCTGPSKKKYGDDTGAGPPPGPPKYL